MLSFNTNADFSRRKLYILLGILAFALVDSVVDVVIYQMLPSFYNGYFFASALTMNLLVYAWYFFDREERGKPFSRRMFVLFLFIGTFIIPFHLFRNRPPQKRLSAIGKFFGVVALCLALGVLGGYLGDLIV